MNEKPESEPLRSGPWFAVFCCAWKLDIGNDTRETEKPNAIFRVKEHADEYAKRWPNTAEVRPQPMEFHPANTKI